MRQLLDRTLIVLTLISFVSLGYFAFFPNYALARQMHPWVYFLVGTLFLNTTHIFITFISIKFIPEIGSLSFLRSPQFYFRCFFVFFGAAAVTFTCLLLSRDNELLIGLLRIFIYAATVHHTLMQTYGLSSQVDLRNRKNYFEKNSVIIFTLISIVMYAIVRLSSEAKLSVPIFTLIAAWLILSILIIKSFSREKKFTKSVFLARYLCVFLCFIHPIYTLMTMTFHGLEYLHTFLRNKDNSKMDRVKATVATRYLWVLLPLAAIFIHFSFLVNLLGTDKYVPTVAFSVVESLVMGFNFLHFFLDARIYQFKNREVYEKVSSLFEGTVK